MPAQLRPRQQIVERVVEKEVVREVPSARPAQFVAVFQKDEQSPAFVMSVDIDKRMVTVRQVAAERLADKSYQLWIATQPGGAPQSLGAACTDDFTVKATLAAYDPAVINNATFGISLEPLGGSPTDRPTGPVIHAKLLQVTPPQSPHVAAPAQAFSSAGKERPEGWPRRGLSEVTSEAYSTTECWIRRAP